MKSLTKLGYFAAACALVVTTSTMIGPHTVRAAVATLVQVANPASNPALTSAIDEPGRIPYQSVLSQTCGGPSATCNFVFGAVPAGHRLVVQHMSGQLTVTALSTYIEVTAGPDVPGKWITQLQLFVNNSTFQSFFDMPVHFYVDAGESPTVSASTYGAVPFQANNQVVSLSGYLLDCTAAPCAAIASF
jgi:hypothetical protein